MRRTRALLTLVLLALSALWAAGPADAGGPTSVLLSVPGEGRMAALYYTDADYQRLSELVGFVDSAAAPSGSEPSHETARMVTLTWLIHDVQVWRVDRVYMGGAGDRTWVETQQVEGVEPIWEAPVVWHRAGRELLALLARTLPKSASVSEAVAPVLDDTTAPVPATAAAASAPSALVVATWTAGGIAAGAVLALVVVRRQIRRRPDPVDGMAPMTDQLAWP